ncbi:N-acetylmuramoyl-L-alanine amidase [Clostridium magnum]|uniref:N-acetylmuramoyl-L-alanine amidase LytC n=1 Tax=Clostridium magnum DSM 2767 TaxID=1121326 RepID=A0A162TQL0_9CLOT|nr:N-acetylmuramoyl-L-alanine amidase [Clostridium magnum]KZL92925.1 N-acetylmuramoyl-L-alanine amidase LytC precursor [Clostridium magnum DSM 2767]SHJ16510.1 N-acetylmuramoyl-L-alanine amidase CwlD [Clostridium magnum DSM 2767]
MKSIKGIALFAFSILFLILSVSSKCLAASDTDYVNTNSKISPVAINKILTVKFNNSLNSNTINNNNVLVQDENNNAININVSIGDDNKSIIVSPTDNYEYGKNYTLIVTKGVQSSTGKNLSKPVRMKFTTVSQIKRQAPITVTIDAGHGGYDSGAVGPTGVLEKNITLPIALKVGEILSKNGINVIYTRTSDDVVWPSEERADLQKRCDISDKANADYFVAIHVNSADVPSVNGLETYYFEGSLKGEKLAKSVEQQLVQATGVADRGVKTDGFYVLKNTNAVAILTEIGFISNPDQEKVLNTPEYQNKYAEAIATGILKYLGMKS